LSTDGFDMAADASSVVFEDPTIPRPDELGLQESSVPFDGTSIRLIERFFPTDVVSSQSHKERYSRGQTPHTIFTWWARRPFAAASGLIASALIRGESLEGADSLVEEHCLSLNHRSTQEALKELIGPKRQRVLDVFGGGGTIPMEAASAGVRAYSLENNELAHFIQQALLRMSQEDASLPSLVKSCGQAFLKRLEDETESFYPSRHHGEAGKTIAYFWSRSVHCGKCAGKLSLLKRPWLARRKQRTWFIARQPDHELRRYTTRLEHEGAPEDAGSAWQGSKLVCPFCDHEVSERKEQEALLMESGFDELVACATIRPGRPGKLYHISAPDGSCQDCVAPCALSGAIADDLAMMGEQLPDSPIPTWSGVTNPTLYGIHHFHEMFGLRQLAVLVRTCRLFHELYPEWVEAHGESRARAIAAFLSGFIDQLADWNNRLSTWISQNEQVGRSLAGPGLPMVWDFVEIDPLMGGPANLHDKLDRIIEGMRAVPQFEHRPAVVKGDARRLPFKAKSFDVVATDPPYFDNVFYSVLADCIYVWKRLALSRIFPEYFGPETTNITRELSANRYRHGDQEQARRFYAEAMTEVFKEIRRVLKPDGVLALIFAHSAVDGWAALSEAYQVAQLKLVAVWPMQVERRHRPRGMNARAVNVSFVLVARRRYECPPAKPWSVFEALVRERIVVARQELIDKGAGGDELGHSLVGTGVCVLSEQGLPLDEGGCAMTHLEAVEGIARIVEELVPGFSVLRR
jgi:putative DNA methylase